MSFLSHLYLTTFFLALVLASPSPLEEYPELEMTSEGATRWRSPSDAGAGASCFLSCAGAAAAGAFGGASAAPLCCCFLPVSASSSTETKFSGRLGALE